MNETITKLLSIQVAMSGIDRVEAAVLSLTRAFGATTTQLDKLKTKLDVATRGMAPLLALISGEIFTGAKWETAQVRLEAFTHSTSLAAEQMDLIEHIAAKGVFRFDDITSAIDKLDQMQISLRDNLDLVEKLGARTGSIENAADLVGRIAGGRGSVPFLVRRLSTMGITPEMLTGAGLNVHGNTISNSPGQILDTLKKIEAMDPILTKLQGTLGATFGGLLFNLMKIVQIMSGPASLAMKLIFTPVNHLLQGIIQLNKWTYGLLGHFLGIIALVSAFEKIAKIWGLISGFIKVGAFWQAVLNTYSKAYIALRALLSTMVVIYELLTGKIKLAAAWQAVLDALTGQWQNLAAAVVVAAVVGIGWHFGESDPTIPGDKAPDRPHRRDDIENVYKKLYGKNWTG